MERFRAIEAQIRLVLLDMTMPHLDGAATFRELRRICEDVQVIVMSGYNAFAYYCCGPLARGDIIRYRQHRIHLAPSV